MPPHSPLPTDPAALIGNAAEFPVLNHWHYFNHAGVCPLPRVAADALRTYADEASRGAYLNTTWYARLDTLRHTLARFIGAHRDEIALLKNTSEGLATVAAGLDRADYFSPGDRIITAAVEYSSNIYPWMDLARRRGLELVLVPERTRDDGSVAVDEHDLLRELDHPRTKLLALSHVQFASGQRMDLARLGAACRGGGILFCVDAIQTVGVLPVDVEAMKIDFLAADGHKWLLGPEGAGFLYVRRELMDRLPPPLLGWNSVRNPQAYGTYDLTLRATAARYECGTLTIPAFLALLASAQLLTAADTDFVSARLHTLTHHLATGLTAKGYTVHSPRDAHRWSGSVAFTPPTPHDSGGGDLKAHLIRLRKDHRIELALREGRLRCSPHFYNTEAELDLLLAALPD